MDKYKTIVMLMFTWLTISAMAQEQLSLEDCKKLVITRNERALIADAVVAIKEEVIDERKADFLPAVSSSVTALAFTDNPVLKSLASYSGLADVSVEQPVYTGGKLKALNNLAAIDRKIAVEQRRLSHEALTLQVEQLYWQVVSVNQQVVVAENYLNTLRQLEQKIKNYFEAGLVNKTELLETQVASNQATYNLEVAQNFQKIAKRQLANSIGREDTEFTVQEDFTITIVSPSLSGDINTAFNLRPELTITQNALLAKEKEYSLINSEYRPQIGLIAGGYYYRGEETVPGEVESDQFFGGAFLTVSIPIFDWGKKFNRLKVNQLEASQLNWEKSQTEKQISLEVENAIYQMDESNINVALTEKSKEQAAENVRITNDNYDGGLITSEEVLEAEALNQQAQLDYIRAKVQQQLSYSNYRKALGELSN